MDNIFHGSTGDFEQIVAKNKLAVYATALSHIDIKANADDIVQETFIYAYYNFGKLNDPLKLSAWLCGIARNLSLKLHRDQRTFVSMDDIAEQCAAENPETEYLESETRRELMDAIAELSNPIAETITLHYLAGMRVDEIAGILSIPEGTVKWRLSEGRRKLKRELGKIMKNEKNKIETNDMERKIADMIRNANAEMERSNNTGALSICDDAIRSIEDSDAYYRSLIELYKIRSRVSYHAEGVEAARSDGRKRVALARLLDDQKVISECLLDLAFAYNTMEFEKERECLTEAFAIAQSIGYTPMCSEAAYWLGMGCIYKSEFDQAETYLNESIKYYQESGTGTVHLCEGDFKRIRALAKAALRSISALRKANMLGLSYCYIGSHCQIIDIKHNKVFAGNNYGWSVPGIDFEKCDRSHEGVFGGLGLILRNEMKDGLVITFEEYNTDSVAYQIEYKVVSMSENLATRAGTFEKCIHLQKSTGAPENSAIDLWFAPDVGLVKRAMANESCELLNYSVRKTGSQEISKLYFPLSEGDAWNYDHSDESLNYVDGYEVDLISDRRAFISNHSFGYLQIK